MDWESRRNFVQRRCGHPVFINCPVCVATFSLINNGSGSRRVDRVPVLNKHVCRSNKSLYMCNFTYL